MGIFLGGRNDDGVDVRRQMTVSVRDRLFIVKIGHIPDPSDYMPDAQLFTEIDSEAIITHDPDSAQPLSGLRDDVLTLLH